jgi:hypothetical protein
MRSLNSGACFLDFLLFGDGCSAFGFESQASIRLVGFKDSKLLRDCDIVLGGGFGNKRERRWQKTSAYPLQVPASWFYAFVLVGRSRP